MPTPRRSQRRSEQPSPGAKKRRATDEEASTAREEPVDVEHELPAEALEVDEIALETPKEIAMHAMEEATEARPVQRPRHPHRLVLPEEPPATPSEEEPQPWEQE